MFSLLISYYIILHLLPESKKILNPVPNQHTILDSLPIPTNISQVIIIIPSYLLPPCFKLSFSLPLLEVRECQSFNNRSHWIDNWIQAKMIQLFELTFSWELHHPKVISIIIPLTARKNETRKRWWARGRREIYPERPWSFFGDDLPFWVCGNNARSSPLFFGAKRGICWIDIENPLLVRSQCRKEDILSMYHVQPMSWTW